MEKSRKCNHIQSIRQKMKNNHVLQLLPVVVFAAILFGLAGVGMLSVEKSYSATEKRELQTMPKLSKKSIRKGTFQKKYEMYLSDQFPGRDDWVQLQTDVSRALGKSESNGVYFGKDGYLLEQYTDQDFESGRAEKNETALVDFAAHLVDERRVFVMLVPTKTWVLRDKLPAFAPTYDEQRVYDVINRQLGTLADQVMVPVAETMQQHKDEAVYYRTDHHWTTLGAWYGYEAYLEASGADAQQLAAAQKKKEALTCVSTSFYGTTYAKIHQAPRADEIDAYEPQVPLQVVYNMGETDSDSLFDASYLGTEDEYSYFTGGNQALIQITGGAKNGRTLFVIKDSFANCMLPFLAEDYETLVVADLRQLNAPCGRLIQMFDPDDVLILYNTAQFASDREFASKCKT